MLDDMPDICREVERKARKQHICRECAHPIEPGETYMDCATLFDHSWTSYKLCDCCNEWAEATGIKYEGWTLGELENTIKYKFERTPYDPDTPRYLQERVYYVVPETGGQDGPTKEETDPHLRRLQG